MRKPVEAPGVLRLRALDAKPRLPTARSVVAAVVAPPVMRKPARARPVDSGQARLLLMDPEDDDFQDDDDDLIDDRLECQHCGLPDGECECGNF